MQGHDNNSTLVKPKEINQVFKEKNCDINQNKKDCELIVEQGKVSEVFSAK